MANTLEGTQAEILAIQIIDLAKDAGYLTAINLDEYPMSMGMCQSNGGQMSLFPEEDRLGTCHIEFLDGSLNIETGGGFSIDEKTFSKILSRFRKCCTFYALATHRETFEGVKKEPAQ